MLLRDRFDHEDKEILKKWKSDLSEWKKRRPTPLAQAEIVSIIESYTQKNGTIPPKFEGRVKVEFTPADDEKYKVIDLKTEAWRQEPFEFSSFRLLFRLLWYLELEKDHITYEDVTAGKLVSRPLTADEINSLPKDVEFVWKHVENEDGTTKQLSIEDLDRVDYTPVPPEVVFLQIKMSEADKKATFDLEDEADIARIENALYDFFGTTTASVSLTKDSAIPIITNQKHKNATRSIATVDRKQVQFEIGKDGAIVPQTIKDEHILMQAIEKARATVDDPTLDWRLYEAIGAGVEALSDEYSNPIMRIKRRDLEVYLDTRIRKPTEDIINFIKKNYIPFKNVTPSTPEDEAMRKNIERSYSFWINLIKLDYAVGYVGTEEGIYKAFTFRGYNLKNDYIECDSPHLFQVFKELKSKSRQTDDGHDFLEVSHAVRGSLYGNKNVSADEVLRVIVNGIVTRGVSTPDAKLYPKRNYKNKNQFTYGKIYYSTLIDRCESLKKVFSMEKGTKASSEIKKTYLERAIGTNSSIRYFNDNKKYLNKPTKDKTFDMKLAPTLIQLLDSKTDFNKRLVNFRIEIDPISLKTLSRDGIKIQWDGLNGDYVNDPDIIPAFISEITTQD